MNNFDKITIIANQLANDGKKPSVALIKAKLAAPIPLTHIISALKNWQHDPENCTFPKTDTGEEDKNGATTSDKKELTEELVNQAVLTAVNVAIEKALVPIKAELAAVKAELVALKN